MLVLYIIEYIHRDVVPQMFKMETHTNLNPRFLRITSQ